MKTLILNANSDKKVNTIIVNRVKKLSQKYKNHFSFDYLRNAPLSIQGKQDGALAKTELIKYFKQKNNRKFNNYILCCFDDIALDEVCSLVRKPVFSLCQSSVVSSNLLTGKTIIITINKKSIGVIKRLLKKYNSSNIKVYSLNLDIINIHNKNFSMRLRKNISNIVKKTKAQNVILGSTGLTKFKERLQKYFTINLIDGLECSLQLAGVRK